jgi:protein-L-isoaspartate(D-aspartate) O-methyltransferase
MRRRTESDWTELRRRMVNRLQATEDLSPLALQALGAVPRHRFVPAAERDNSYHNRPLPIGLGQTISQPYMVGWLVDALELRPGMRVLEIGSGCGYQAAVLAAAGARVWSVEIREALSLRARVTLDALGLGSVCLRVGDGAAGWPEAAPFDGIVLTAAPVEVPDALFHQLAPGGWLVAPVGPVEEVQTLVRYRLLPRGRTVAEADEYEAQALGGCHFVPMVDGRGRQR